MKIIIKYLLAVIIALNIFSANAEILNNNINFNNSFEENYQQNNLLANEDAFKLAILESIDKVTFTWSLAPGYYLYKDRIKVTGAPNINLNKYINLPENIVFFDKNLNKEFKVYANTLEISIDKIYIEQYKIREIKVNYQGCSNTGFCYTPIEKNFTIKNNNDLNSAIQNKEQNLNEIQTDSTQDLNSNKPNIINNFYSSIDKILLNKSIIKICIAFFVFGVLLSLSPCVLPMIPIILSIVVGRIDLVSKSKRFILALSYVISMAITYAVIGIIAGALGYNLQVYMQHPYIIIAISIFITILAFYMFDIIKFNSPININKQIYKLEKSQGHGALINAVALGAIAALVITPCVTPALIAAITFLANDGSPLTGGLALFAMGFGIGTPLILFAFGGSLLIPTAGKWTTITKRASGFILLGLAIWLLERTISNFTAVILWLTLITLFTIFLLFSVKTSNKKLNFVYKSLILIFAIFSCLVAFNRAGVNLFLVQKPWIESNTNSTTIDNQNIGLNWNKVTNLKDLKIQVVHAKQLNKKSVVLYTADWCSSCQNLKQQALKDIEVINKLASCHLIMVDITMPNKDTEELLDYYNVYGVPTMIFLDSNGYVTGERLIGDIQKNQILKQIKH